jgi:lipopolysaccharide transport system permease protein
LLRTLKGAVQRANHRYGWLPTDSSLWVKLDLLKTLVQRDLQARYKGSVLGNLWPLLNQIFQLLIYTYVFSIVLRIKLNLEGLPENNITFGLWLFAGFIPWFAFAGGLVQATTSVIAQPNLVKKVVFPLTLLPLVPVLSVFIENSLGLVALITLVAITTQTIHVTLWLLPLVWLPQILLTVGLGYLAAGLTVFLRDVPQTLGSVLNLWLYLTPIVYPLDIIPEAWRGWILWLNPMAVIAEVYRGLVLNGTIRCPLEWGITSLVSIVIFYLGLRLYQRLSPMFADVL